MVETPPLDEVTSSYEMTPPLLDLAVEVYSVLVTVCPPLVMVSTYVIEPLGVLTVL
jgi:hypothetical protein